MAMRKFQLLNVIRETENERTIEQLLEQGYKELDVEETREEPKTKARAAKKPVETAGEVKGE